MGGLEYLSSDVLMLLLEYIPPSDTVCLFATGSLTLQRRLPKCVTRMSIGVVPKCDLHWWPNLQELALDERLRRVESLDLSSYMNLRALDLPYHLESTGIELSELPHLTSLKAFVRGVDAFLLKTNAPLVTLHLLNSSGVLRVSDYHGESLSRLPESLVSLRLPIRGVGQTTRIQTGLPNLVSLAVPSTILHPELAMPTSLKRLSLRPNGLPVSFLSKLPSGLETLEGQAFDHFDDHSVSLLPQSLTHLEISLSNITGDSIASLPLALRTLVIGSTRHTLNAHSLALSLHSSLQSLTDLSLGGNAVFSSDDDVANLPRTLKRLKIVNGELTGPATLHLPPELEVLIVSNPNVFHFQEPTDLQPWIPFCFDPKYIAKLPLTLKTLIVEDLPESLHALLFERLPTSLCFNTSDFSLHLTYNILFDLRECTSWEDAVHYTKQMREVLKQLAYQECHQHGIPEEYAPPSETLNEIDANTVQITDQAERKWSTVRERQRRLIVHTVFPQTVEFSLPLVYCADENSDPAVSDMVEFMKLVQRLYEIVSSQSGRTGLATIETHNIILPSADLSKLRDIRHIITIRDNRRLRDIHHAAVYDVLAPNSPRSKFHSRLSLSSFTLYNDVAVGGTFDYMHAGHKMLLSACLLSARNRLVIGITGAPLLVKKSNKEYIQAFEMRRKNVETYCKMQRPDLYLELAELNEPAGPTAIDPNFDLLVVSEETASGIAAINAIREKKGLREMKGLTIQLAASSEAMKHLSTDAKISSTTLRLRQKMLEAHLYAMNPLASPPPHVTPVICADPDF